MFYSYIYLDPRNNEPFYVGKGKGDRAYVHLKRCRNPMLANKINKLKTFNIEPLIGKLQTSTEEYAFMLEQGLIKLLGRKNNNTGVLCNLTDGGEGTANILRSEEHNQKVSQKLKGIIRGPLSEDHKARMSATKKLKPSGTGKWMNKDGKQTKVSIENVEKYIAEGWKLGVIGKHITEDYRLKLKQKTIEQWNNVKATGHTGLLKKINEVTL